VPRLAHVHLDDEIRSRIQTPRHSFGGSLRAPARGPAEKVPIGVACARAHVAFEACERVGLVELARSSGPVEANVGDSRFPNGGGEAITMYSLNTNKVGTPTDTLVTFSTDNYSIYNGFEVSANARFGKGFVFSGVTTERTATADCDGQVSATGNTARDNPNALRFCDNVRPFRTLFKASAAYTVKYEHPGERFLHRTSRQQRGRHLPRDIRHRRASRDRDDGRHAVD
jgi:hypothetical protein